MVKSTFEMARSTLLMVSNTSAAEELLCDGNVCVTDNQVSCSDGQACSFDGQVDFSRGQVRISVYSV